MPDFMDLTVVLVRLVGWGLVILGLAILFWAGRYAERQRD